MGEKRNACRVLVGKPEEATKKTLLRRRLKDNIKMDLRVVECGDMDWIHLFRTGISGGML
jgi:hypothetical protein